MTYAIFLASVLRLLAALAVLVGSSATAAPNALKEYELKAAFLYNFTKFVDWPASAFSDSTTPIVIGVYGRSPFGHGLLDAIRARKVDGRPIELRSISTLDEAKSTHLVFFPGVEDEAAVQLLPQLRHAAILTVGESPTFQGQGGVITFVVDGDRLRFVIDMDAAHRAGLKISAQLQKLAQHVRRNS